MSSFHILVCRQFFQSFLGEGTKLSRCPDERCRFDCLITESHSNAKLEAPKLDLMYGCLSRGRPSSVHIMLTHLPTTFRPWFYSRSSHIKSKEQKDESLGREDQLYLDGRN
jgi:hypothetical protein